MRISIPSHKNRPKNEGLAVIVILALLGLILAFIFANMRTLSDLRGELKIIEQKQIRRIGQSMTNALPHSSAVPPTNSAPAQTTGRIPE